MLERGTVAADASIAARLHVAPGDAVFRLRRLRLADGEPMGVQTAYIPLRLVPGIMDIRFEGASLYQVLSDRNVQFRFLHTVTNLGVENGAVTTIELPA